MASKGTGNGEGLDEFIHKLESDFMAIRKTFDMENSELNVCRKMLLRVAATMRSCLPPVLIPDLTSIDHILYSDTLPPTDDSKKLRSLKLRAELIESCLKHCHAVFFMLIQDRTSNLLLDSVYLQLVHGMSKHDLEVIKFPIENTISDCLTSGEKASLCFGVKLLRVLLTKHKESFEDVFYDQVFLVKRMMNLPIAERKNEIAINKWLRSQATYICNNFLRPRTIYRKIPALKELEKIAFRFSQNDFLESVGQLIKLCRDCKNGDIEMFHGEAFLTTGILDSLKSFFLVGSKNELAKRKRAKYFLQSCLQSSSINSIPGRIHEAAHLRKSLEILLEVLTGLFDYYFEMASNMEDKMNILVMKSPTSLVDHSLSKARLAAAQRFDVRSCLDHPRPSNLTDSEWFDQELLDMSDENSNGYVEDTPPKNMDLTTEHFMFYDPLIKVSQIILVIHSMSLHWGELLHIENLDPLIPREKFNSPGFSSEIFSFLCEEKVNEAWWYRPILMKCPFLASFACREEFFRYLMQKKCKNAGTVKFQLNRENILKDMTIIFNSHIDVKKKWTFQFIGEIGEGSGVTKEVYSLFSKIIQKHSLNLWRGSPTSNDPATAYTFSENGLFPNPLKSDDKVEEYLCMRTFRTIGKMLGKSFMDNQLLDIDFSPPLIKFLMNCERGKVVYNYVDLKTIVPLPSSFLSELIRVVTSKQHLQVKYAKNPEALNIAIESLTVDGCNIEDLGIDFTLPGYPDVEMTKGGKNMTVTAHNVDLYFDLILQWYLVSGTKSKLDAIREGFFSTVPIRYMSLFYYDEAKLLFCGTSNGPWESKDILDNCILAGYTEDSSAVKYLLEVMCAFNSDEQKEFLQFVTANLRLPADGFVSLDPPFTISLYKVNDPDSYLPSSATCFNRLMLPNYSSFAITRQKLFQAMQEGKGSFHVV